jgi:hypothetical protein
MVEQEASMSVLRSIERAQLSLRLPSSSFA